MGNGSTSTFSFNFIYNQASDISVIYTDTSGIQTLLTSSQYTLFLNPPAVGQIWGVGGTVTYPKTGSPIVNGTSLTIIRTVPLTQTTSISNQGNFAPIVIEQALDTLCQEIQQVSARTGQYRGTWQTGIAYNFGDIVQDGANGANTLNYYTCIIANTSGTWSTDLANGDWSLSFNTAAVIGYTTAAAASAASASTSASTATTEAGIATTQAGIATTQAGIATTEAGIATTQATNAAASATAAQTYAAALSGTSTTSLAIGTGSQTFITQSSKQWTSGQFLQISSNANAANYMHGSVTSYSGTTLIMNITDVGGSGTHNDWNIAVSGTQGPVGPPGGGTVTSVGLSTPTEFSVSGSPVTGSGTLAFSKANQNANLVYAGPTSGGASAPTFRSLVAADLPTLSSVYPVGSIYMNTTSTNPATLLGFGTWAAFAQGLVLVGVGTGTDSNSVTQTFTAGTQVGEYKHTLTAAETPVLSGTVGGGTNNTATNTGVVFSAGPYSTTNTATYNASVNSGGGASHNNVQPSMPVYIWQRTA